MAKKEEIKEVTAEEIVEQYEGQEPAAQDDGEELETVEGDLPEAEEMKEEEA